MTGEQFRVAEPCSVTRTREAARHLTAARAPSTQEIDRTVSGRGIECTR